MFSQKRVESSDSLLQLIKESDVMTNDQFVQCFETRAYDDSRIIQRRETSVYCYKIPRTQNENIFKRTVLTYREEWLDWL